MAKRDGKDVTVLFKISGVFRKFARFVVHEGDGSLYVIPFTRNKIYRLGKLKDQHIASIVVDSPESMPVFEGEPNTNEDEIQYDLVVPLRDQDFFKPITFPIWVNSENDVFRGPGNLMTITAGRREGKGPIRFRVGAISRAIKYEDVHEPGIVVIPGWDVEKMDTGDPSQFIYLVGK